MKRTDVIMAWYLQRSQKEAKAEADLLQALRDVAQILAWQNNRHYAMLPIRRQSRCKLTGVC